MRLRCLNYLSALAATPVDQNPLSEDFGFTGDLYRLTEEQAQAIFEIRLHRLTAMEQSKLMEDYQGVLDEIADLLDILGSYERLISVVSGELEDIRDTYGDERRTEIIASQQDLSDEDLITEEEEFGHHIPSRLCQNAAAGYLSGPASRRSRQGRNVGKGRGLC